jgi:DNA-binding beta-propeller fold protein YncE
MRGWRWVYVGTVVLALVVGLGLWNPFSPVNAKNPQVPRYVVDPFWPKPLPVAVDPITGITKPWVTGDVAGTCVDSNDHVFTVNRQNLVSPETLVATPSPVIIEFDREGNVVNAGPTDPALIARLPNGVHGCFVDYQDNVWIAGNGDGIVLKFSHDLSTILLQIGTKGVCDTPSGPGACGNVQQKGTSTTLLNQPADIAVDPSNGDIYIADGYGNHRVVVFDKNGVFLRDWGGVGTGPGLFTSGDGGHPHCVVLGDDGLVYACDRGQDRIEVFTKAGVFVRQIAIVPGTGSANVFVSPPTPGLGTAGSAWDVDFSADKKEKLMFDTDGGNEVVWILDRATDTILAGFGRPGHMAGEFTFLHTVAADTRGNLFTGETINGRRIQKFTRQGNVPDKDLDVFTPAGNQGLHLRHYDPVKK